MGTEIMQTPSFLICRTLKSDSQSCSRCGETKDMDLFKKDKSRLSGRGSWCKSCHSKSAAKTQLNNPNKNKNHAKYKATEKGVACTERYKRGESCREARYRYNSSELGSAAHARWCANRRDYNLVAANSLTLPEWNEILKQQDYRCLCCEKAFSNESIKDRAERDHIIPLSKGGPLRMGNVQALCRSCNASKGDKMVSYINWAGNDRAADSTFLDLPHFEIGL
jgi:5-methylcytosine-specific restriction endonuclease McrA